MKQIIQNRTKEPLKSGRGKFTTSFSPSQGFYSRAVSGEEVRSFSWLRFTAITICFMAAWLITAVVLRQKLSFFALPLGLLCGLFFRKSIHRISTATAAGILFFMAGGINAFIISSLFLMSNLNMTIEAMISGFGFWSFMEAVLEGIIVMDWVYLVGAGILTGLISGSKLFLRKQNNTTQL